MRQFVKSRMDLSRFAPKKAARRPDESGAEPIERTAGASRGKPPQ
jgi:hypothetical protein